MKNDKHANPLRRTESVSFKHYFALLGLKNCFKKNTAF